MMKQTVRFWTWVNGGYVRLALRPGETLSHATGGPTEEGWSWASTTWELTADGETLRQEWISDGADCDGRLTRGGELEAPADPARFVDCWEFEGKRPDWQEADEFYRDHQAEAAGY